MIPSYICANPCYLWETFLYKKLLCVPWILWEYSSPTDCTDQHRWLVALVAAWVRQDAIPSYICVNPCYLWETFLCKKLLCVSWVMWEYSSPTDCTDQHRWLGALVRPRNPQNSQKFGCVSGCLGTAGCHTLLHLCKSAICGRPFSARSFCGFRAFCGNTVLPRIALINTDGWLR